jgi:hypothetical protein
MEQEMACDAASLSCIGESESKNYAETLIVLIENQSKAIPVASLANLFGSRSQIRRRITMIKLFGKSKARWSIGGLVIVLFLAGAVLTNANTTKGYNNYLSIESDVHNLIFGLPNYHTPVNQEDIKEITIAIDGVQKAISTEQGSTIIKEFNNARISRVRNLDVSSSAVVEFAFKDGNKLNIGINGNEIRVSRHIGAKKVDYIAENPKMIEIVTGLYNKTDTSTIGVPEKVNIPTNNPPEIDVPIVNGKRFERYPGIIAAARKFAKSTYSIRKQRTPIFTWNFFHVYQKS